MTFLTDELYSTIERSVPILCVDFVVTRTREGSDREVGLIRRESPFGKVWCHLGGRVRRGETVRDAVLRHFDESLDGELPALGPDPQPDYVYQWFPDEIAPSGALPVGRDPRKHAVALSFALPVEGSPALKLGGEALEFAFWPEDGLPRDLWPGCDVLFARLLA